MPKKFTLKEVVEIAKKLEVNTKVVPIKTLQIGMNIELEHSNITNGDPIKTAKIALAHLKEFSDYYTKLVKLEKTATKQKKKIIK
jgi:hypothetical protein